MLGTGRSIAGQLSAKHLGRGRGKPKRQINLHETVHFLGECFVPIPRVATWISKTSEGLF